MDDEEADLLRQRDLQRLQTMERYCQTTECLRNYILAYFGEHPTAPCGNCGSCNNDFDEVDMTDAAKWMINCVAELRGGTAKRFCSALYKARTVRVCESWEPSASRATAG